MEENKSQEKIKYLCPKCNKTFPNQYKLNRHLNKKYPCDKDSTQCIYCGKFFYDSSTKTRHENISCKQKLNT
jgi:uncharacterized C2H2 Zn-finger protein